MTCPDAMSKAYKSLAKEIEVPNVVAISTAGSKDGLRSDFPIHDEWDEGKWEKTH